MDPRNGDDRTKPGSDGKAAAPNRRGSAVTAVLLCLAVALVIDGVVGERGWLANRRGRQQYDQALREYAQVRAQNEAAKERARRLLEQDPAAIEELARRSGYIHPGEKLFIVRDQLQENGAQGGPAGGPGVAKGQAPGPGRPMPRAGEAPTASGAPRK